MKKLLTLLVLALPAAAALSIVQVQQVGPLKLNMAEPKMAQSLGKYSSEGKAVHEAATGLTVKERHYAKLGLKVTLAQEAAGARWTVARFRAEPPCPWKTPQGVGLGTPEAKVRKTYGALLDKEMTNAEQIVVGSVYDGVIFSLKDGKVSAIFVGAAAE